jgi:hypothetical protein
MSCQSLHDWCEQEDSTGYTWNECSQCSATEHAAPDDDYDRDEGLWWL